VTDDGAVSSNRLLGSTYKSFFTTRISFTTLLYDLLFLNLPPTLPRKHHNIGRVTSQNQRRHRATSTDRVMLDNEKLYDIPRQPQ
jgi:hypothetical protein